MIRRPGIRRTLALVLACGVWAGSTGRVAAADKSGVTPNAISLPSGPGSIEGLGESFEPMLNTGTAKYGLTIKVRPGVAGHTPSVALSYEGGRGNGPVGFGWELSGEFIQRQTDKGIPRYVDTPNGLDDDGDGSVDEPDEVDRFVADAGEELVPTADGFFFWKNETSFIRYRRVPGTCSLSPNQSCLSDQQCPASETCSGFFWEATLPNGTQQQFGVTPQGRITDAATGRVFTWLLERSVDTNGNAILYRYDTFDDPSNFNQRYLSMIAYGPGSPRAGGTPWDNFQFVRFNYETRPDWFEDARAGFLRRTGMRLRDIIVGTQGPTLAGHARGDFNADTVEDFLDCKYELTYQGDPYWSLLTTVTLFGADGANSLPPLALSYTGASLPDTVSASGAILGSANTPALVMDSPYVDLVDLNGDGLPDILKTDAFGGAHRAYLNTGEVENEVTWADGVDEGGAQDAWGVNLGSSSTIAHLTDMDGDGLADLTYKSAAGDVYYFPNSGNVSWGSRVPMNVDPSDSAPPSPFGTDDVRTADIDFDKREDVIQSVSNGFGADYRIWFNRGGGQYAQSVTVAQDAGFMLSDPGVEIADINGDRVPDIARLRPTELQVTPGLGHGQFAPLVSIRLPDILEDSQVAAARLIDMSGDGLTDLVLERAEPGKLWYWINLGNYTFDHRRIITGTPAFFGVEPAIRWADMNGNGTTDLVYADQSSDPRLQVVDVGRLLGAEPKPKQLRLIDNGLGRRMHIEYRNVVAYMQEARAADNAWHTVCPNPLQVVSRVTVTPGLELDDTPGVDAYVTDFVYRDCYYDAHEKQFRGFAFVKKIDRGDEDAPTQVVRMTFHTGAPDGIDNNGDHEIDERAPDGSAEEESLKGRLLRQELTTAGGGADSSAQDGRDASDALTFQRTVSDWLVRLLAASDGGSRGVATLDGRRVSFAFNSEANQFIIELGSGPAEQLRTTSAYDDFGNLTEKREYGALSRTGDERFTLSEFIHDTERWIIRNPRRALVSDGDGNRITERRAYYDGQDYVGLPSGQVTRGRLTREEAWVEGASYIEQTRNAFDAFGNVIGLLDPLGDPANPGAGHARAVGYDPTFHTFPVTETIHVGGGNAPLAMSASYDVGLGIVTTSTDFNGNLTSYGHDVFGRMTSIVKPGDSTAFPTAIFAYAMADPERGIVRQYDQAGNVSLIPSAATASSVTTRAREDVGQPGTFATVQYVDGLGRKLAHVEEARTGFAVKDAVRFTARQTVRATFQPYATAMIDYALPELDQPSARIGYDAMGRETTKINPPDQAGNVSEVKRSYLPLVRTVLDELQHERADVFDGLMPLDDQAQRPVEVHEVNDGERYITTYAYNAVDSLTRITDAQNNATTFGYDGLQRKVFLDHVDRGRMTYAYDAASNLIETADAKGQATTYVYEGANRVVSEDYHDEGQPFSSHRSPDVTYRYDTPSGPVDRGDGTSITPTQTRGLLVSVRDLSGEEHTSYDARGRVQLTVKSIPDTETGLLVSYTTQTAYDSMDRPRTLVYPDGDRLNYVYDTRNLLQRITGGPTGCIVCNIDYTPSGQQQRVDYGNGVATTYAYDPRRRLVDLHTFNAAADLIHYRYGLDATSNIRRIDDLRPGSAAPAGDPRRNTQLFDYDDLHRLTGVQYSFALPGQGDRDDGTIGYTYDRIGNMLSQVSSIADVDPRTGLSLTNYGRMSYGGDAGRTDRAGRHANDPPGPHALTSTESGRSHCYDANGNLTVIDGTPTGNPGTCESAVVGGLRTTWDFKDRLVAVENEQFRADYTYDFTDRRITKHVIPKPTGTQPASARPSAVVYVNRYFEVREHDQPMKYVFAGDTRVAEMTASLDSTETRIQRFRLFPGWNLLALAVEAADPIAQLGLGHEPRLESVYRWDAATKRFTPVGAADAAPAGSVLWVSATQPLQVQVQGSYTEPSSVPLPAGDAFVPGPGLFALSLDSARPLAPVRGWLFDAGQQDWAVRLAPDTNGAAFLSTAPEFLPPGTAAFIHAAVPEDLIVPPPSKRIRYYHQDHLGSSNVQADADGTVVEEAAFYPFASPRHRVGGQADGSAGGAYLFSQKELDPESGLQYFGARFLAAGRFARVDPILSAPRAKSLGNPQSLNGYAYALNNPMLFTDPDGRDPELLGTVATGRMRENLAKAFFDPKNNQICYAIRSGDGKMLLINDQVIHDLGNAIRSGELPLRYGSKNELQIEPDSDTAAFYQNNSLHVQDRAALSPSLTDKAVFIHEAVHNLLERFFEGKLSTLEDESTAYIIQAQYLRAHGEGTFGFDNPIHLAALRFADIHSGKVSGSSVTAYSELQQAIMNNKQYQKSIAAEDRSP